MWRLRQQGLDEELGTGGGPERIPLIQKVVLFLWYMANQNSVREITDKFDVSQWGAHKTILQVLKATCELAKTCMQWQNYVRKQNSKEQFLRIGLYMA